jgi:hypothetical protein
MLTYSSVANQLDVASFKTIIIDKKEDGSGQEYAFGHSKLEVMNFKTSNFRNQIIKYPAFKGTTSIISADVRLNGKSADLECLSESKSLKKLAVSNVTINSNSMSITC